MSAAKEDFELKVVEDSIHIAVRTRPLNKIEKENNAKVVYSTGVEEKDGHSKPLMIIKAVEEGGGDELKFKFDYVLDSVDPKSPDFATQQDAFEAIGFNILTSAWKGFNASLFACESCQPTLCPRTCATCATCVAKASPDLVLPLLPSHTQMGRRDPARPSRWPGRRKTLG